MLAINIKKGYDIKKLNVLGTDIVFSQLVDDTTIFLKNRYQVPISIENFSMAPGLTLHFNKWDCELFSIHDTLMNNICNIPIKSEVRGDFICIVHLTKNLKLSTSLNVGNKLK